jgi:hypothetical protein
MNAAERGRETMKMICYAAVVDLATGEEITSPRVPVEVNIEGNALKVATVDLPPTHKASARGGVKLFESADGEAWIGLGMSKRMLLNKPLGSVKVGDEI